MVESHSWSSASEKNLPMAQSRQNPALGYQNRIFNFGLVPWLVRPRWHDGGAVMLGHLVISAVDIGLIAAGAIDASARVIRHDQFRRAVEEIKGPDMAVDPVGQMLAQLSPAQTCRCWLRAPRQTGTQALLRRF